MLPSEYITALFIAVGLAMDCFAVSVTKGLTVKSGRKKSGFALALSFGAFQGIMPLLGWLAADSFVEAISGLDHWIAFVLLCVVGGKMILEAGTEKEKGGSRPGLAMILMLSIATSIDAFAVGLSFAFLGIEIIPSAAIIGVTSFVLTLTGFFLGSRFDGRLGSKAETAGGTVLLLIGLKILFEHMT
jgi:putative Mn2+ efflux pump MntP